MSINLPIPKILFTRQDEYITNISSVEASSNLFDPTEADEVIWFFQLYNLFERVCFYSLVVSKDLKEKGIFVIKDYVPSRIMLLFLNNLEFALFEQRTL